MSLLNRVSMPGMRWTMGKSTSLRIDYGYGFQDVQFARVNDRVHIGFVTLFGPRP